MAVTQVSRESCVPLRTAPGFVLRSDAAAAWDRATTAFGKRVILTGAWRSYETQVNLFTARYVKGNLAGQPGFTEDVRYWNGQPWTRRKGTAAAAIPGTSNHGGGVAVDVKTRRDPDDPPYSQAVVFTGWSDADRTRFLQVAAQHGWADDEGRRVNEPWHLTYFPSRDRHYGVLVSNPVDSTGGTDIPTPGGSLPEPLEEIDMTPEQAAQLNKIADHFPAMVTDDGQKVSLVTAMNRSMVYVRATNAAVNALQATVTAQAATIQVLASSAGIDPTKIAASIEAAVKKALAGTTTTATITFPTED